jgi:hypothetical protein
MTPYCRLEAKRKFFFYFFFKLFINNQNYIRFYKLICCDSAWREETYPKISPHLPSLRSAGTVSRETNSVLFTSLNRFLLNLNHMYRPSRYFLSQTL